MRNLTIVTTSVLCAVTAQAAEPFSEYFDDPLIDVYSVSASYGDDIFALQLSGDWATSESLRVHFDAGFTDSGSDAVGVDDITMYRANLGFDYNFDPIGVELGYEYWGEGQSFDTHAALASVYFRNDVTYVAAKGEGRRIELSYDIPPLLRNAFDDEQTVNSTGFGASVSQRIDWLTLRADGMTYDYDAPLGEITANNDLSRVPPQLRAAVQARVDRIVERVRVINSASISMAEGLLDHSVGAGFDIAFGSQSLALDAAWEEFAGGGEELNTLSIGWLAPLKSVGDIETRMSYSSGDVYGSSVYVGFTIWIYK
jgi:hypothetical protein